MAYVYPKGTLAGGTGNTAGESVRLLTCADGPLEGQSFVVRSYSTGVLLRGFWYRVATDIAADGTHSVCLMWDVSIID